MTALRPERAESLHSYLAEVREGRAVTREMAVALIRCADGFLADLLETAAFLKEQFKPGIVTYSRKIFLPLTNLCRDHCGYCTFRRSPGQQGAYTMSPEEVLAVCREGERMGCTEALFSLGDKPEAIYPEMRGELRRLGYRSTLAYLEAMCALVLRETKLIPHANPGLMSEEWIARLRQVSPSLGLMIESTSPALLRSKTHAAAPDKIPARRLAVLAAAGRRQVPFTTGVLIGIGESAEDRVDSLLAIARIHREYGHLQEVIIQNFRRKAAIPMAGHPEPALGAMLRTIAVARLLMPRVNLQAPPNLSAPHYERLLEAGINDWGGISPLTPDFINPERPWPHVAEIARRTRAFGCELRQRLPVYPEFLGMAVQAGGQAAEKLMGCADAEGYARTPSSQTAAQAVLNATDVDGAPRQKRRVARSCA